MHALTIWQPWASLIMVGAKPFEFRRWPAPKALVGERIVIHAGARPIKRDEVLELLRAIEGKGNQSGGTGLKPDLARRLLERVNEAHSKSPILPLGAGLGTAVLGKPRKASDLFRGKVRDSDRIDHHVWAWPLTDLKPFDAPIPMRGGQGFWKWQRS